MPFSRAGIELVPQPEVECQARLQTPIVLDVPAEILIREAIAIHRANLAGAERARGAPKEFGQAAKLVNSSRTVALLLDVEHLFEKCAEL